MSRAGSVDGVGNDSFHGSLSTACHQDIKDESSPSRHPLPAPFPPLIPYQFTPTPYTQSQMVKILILLQPLSLVLVPVLV
jgi:hypothetical protein